MKEINLTRGQKAIVDDDIYEALNKLKWSAAYYKRQDCFYPQRNQSRDGRKSRPIERLYWYVVGQPICGMVVDHINGNTLDNRRENLRVIFAHENSRNRERHRVGFHPGVTKRTDCDRWRANIMINGVNNYLGLFKTKGMAIMAYENARRSS